MKTKKDIRYSNDKYPVRMTTPQLQTMILYSMLLCKKRTCTWGRKRYEPTRVGGKQKRSKLSKNKV